MKFRLLSHDSINKQFQVVVWYGVRGVVKVRWLRVPDFRLMRSEASIDSLSHSFDMSSSVQGDMVHTFRVLSRTENMRPCR